MAWHGTLFGTMICILHDRIKTNMTISNGDFGLTLGKKLYSTRPSLCSIFVHVNKIWPLYTPLLIARWEEILLLVSVIGWYFETLRFTFIDGDIGKLLCRYLGMCFLHLTERTTVEPQPR